MVNEQRLQYSYLRTAIRAKLVLGHRHRNADDNAENGKNHECNDELHL